MSAFVRNRDLTGRQQRMIAALLASRSITEAASVVGISERTARRWLGLPLFREALREAKRAVLRNTLGRLQSLSMRATDVLDSLMKRRLQTRDRTELQETGSGTEPDDGGGITIKETGRSPTWLVEQFVQRIAQPGTRAMFIGPDNQNGGWASLADAIRSGRSFCITLRHDVVALDADGKESGRAVEQELVPTCGTAACAPC